jgi:hypothetical protein
MSLQFWVTRKHQTNSAIVNFGQSHSPYSPPQFGRRRKNTISMQGANSPTQCPWKASNHTGRQHFALDLPKEIRLTVYEHLTTHTHRLVTMHHIVTRSMIEQGKDQQPTVPYLQSIIHLSCRSIHDEAISLLKELSMARSAARIIIPPALWCGGEPPCHLPRRDITNDGDGVGTTEGRLPLGRMGSVRTMDGGLPVNSAHQQPR